MWLRQRRKAPADAEEDLELLVEGDSWAQTGSPSFEQKGARNRSPPRPQRKPMYRGTVISLVRLVWRVCGRWETRQLPSRRVGLWRSLGTTLTLSLYVGLICFYFLVFCLWFCSAVGWIQVTTHARQAILSLSYIASHCLILFWNLLNCPDWPQTWSSCFSFPSSMHDPR